MTTEEVEAEFLALQSAYTDLKADEQDFEGHPVVMAKHSTNLARLHARLEAVRQLLEELRAERDE